MTDQKQKEKMVLPTLSIIIVNWNGGEYLKACVDSIPQAITNDFILDSIVIVDNASIDNSIEPIRDISGITVIDNKQNMGFSGACNQGASICSSKYLLFLNPDTMLNPSSLTNPILFMEDKANNKVGICSIQLLDDKNNIQKTCRRFPTTRSYLNKILFLDVLFPERFPFLVMNEFSHEDSRIVDQSSGAYYMIRNSLFHILKGFDEDYFVYFDEVDLSKRALDLGYYTYFLADANAYHVGGALSGQDIPRRLFYSLRSRIIYSSKHFKKSDHSTLLFYTLFLELLTRSLYAIVRLSPKALYQNIKAYLYLYRHMLNNLWQNMQ